MHTYYKLVLIWDSYKLHSNQLINAPNETFCNSIYVNPVIVVNKCHGANSRTREMGYGPKNDR